MPRGIPVVSRLSLLIMLAGKLGVIFESHGTLRYGDGLAKHEITT